MDPAQWKLKAGGPFNWPELESNTVWEVLPTAFPPTSSPRGVNSLYSKCLFGDFNLKLKFRCPDMRMIWRNCNSGLLGPRNWGNSGVYIFDLYELQIHDSFDASLATNPTDLGGCAGGSNPVLTTELCGAMYKFRAPDSVAVFQASTDGMGSPDGQWNTLEIGFMSPRFDNSLNRVKCATVTVKLNGASLYTHLGVPTGTGTKATESQSINLKADTRYGMGWQQSTGPIVLQEHDNRVQFKEIEINPAWIPTVGGGATDPFALCWQRDYDAMTATCKAPCMSSSSSSSYGSSSASP